MRNFNLAFLRRKGLKMMPIDPVQRALQKYILFASMPRHNDPQNYFYWEKSEFKIIIFFKILDKIIVFIDFLIKIRDFYQNINFSNVHTMN